MSALAEARAGRMSPRGNDDQEKKKNSGTSNQESNCYEWGLDKRALKHCKSVFETKQNDNIKKKLASLSHKDCDIDTL